MLKRKIEREIKHWIEKDDKALIIYGARQVGKTYIVRSVLENAGVDWVEFNLIRDVRVAEALKSYGSVDDLILRLSLLSEKPLKAHETFIFLDEIQEFPEIVTAIKFLVEDGRFRYIMSGSLLGVELKNIRSAPVGYLRSLKMYPMDFEEFLQLFNVGDEILKGLRTAFENKTPVDEIIHKRLTEIFNLYLIIGGMPAAVDAYRATESIDEVMNEHRSIIEQYKKDFTKYEQDSKKPLLTAIYDLIPAELNSQTRRFNVSQVENAARYDRIKDEFIWLKEAGVALPVYNISEPKTPLRLNERASLFKLFLSDVGLLTTMYGKATKLAIITDEPSLNKGAVFENAVAEELTAHGYDIYYYRNKKLGELDFVIEYRGRVMPIEVKSGKDYQRHSALDNVLKVENYALDEAVVLCNKNVAVNGKITYYPIYMTMFLTEQDLGETIIPIAKYRF